MCLCREPEIRYPFSVHLYCHIHTGKQKVKWKFIYSSDNTIVLRLLKGLEAEDLYVSHYNLMSHLLNHLTRDVDVGFCFSDAPYISQ